MDESITPAGQPQTGQHDKREARLIICEGAILLAITPLLIFPHIVPVLTTIGLVCLAIIWLVPIFILPRPILPPTPFNLIFLSLGLMLVVGILVTSDPDQTLSKATGLILGLAAWRLMAITIRTPRHVLYGLACLLIVAAGFTFIGIAGLDTIIKIPALAVINPIQQFASPALRDLEIHPNQLAGLISCYLPLLVALQFAGARIPAWARIILGIFTLLAIFVLILTQSRGGWIAAVAGLFVLFILWAAVQPPSRLKRVSLSIAAGVILIGGLSILWIGPERIQSLWLEPPAESVVGTLQTLNYRKELWPWAITAIGDFPFTGTGLGTFRVVAFRLYPLGLNPDYDIGHAHNIFLQTALDVGLPGLIIYLALLLVSGLIGWQIASASTAFRPLALGLIAGFIALHIFGLADALSLGAKPGLIFWLAIGLLTGMNRVVADNRSARIDG